ncbi:glycosyltransferase family 4 protein [Georgenia sp. Marseille-Q6866]
MRITYIHQHFRRPDQAGGSRPWEFTRRLASAGHSVTVICAGDDNSRYEIGTVQVVQLRSTYRNEMSTPARVASFITFMARATLAATQMGAEVIFASSTPLTVAVPAIIASKLRRTPYVFEVRDLWPRVPIEMGYLRNPVAKKFAELLERAAYRHANHVVALSPLMRDGVVSVAPEAAVSVIPNSADISSFTVAPSQAQAYRQALEPSASIMLVYVGSLGESYDVGWLGDFCREITDLPVAVVVAGTGRGRAVLDDAIATYGLTNLRLLGEVPKEQVPTLLAAADGVLSTLADYRGLEANSLNKVFDAYAAGRPIFFNHGGWLTEISAAAGAGWRLSRNPTDAATIFRSIASGSPAVLTNAGAEARTLADHFRRDDHFAQLEAVLTQAAGGAK